MRSRKGRSAESVRISATGPLARIKKKAVDAVHDVVGVASRPQTTGRPHAIASNTTRPKASSQSSLVR